MKIAYHQRGCHTPNLPLFAGAEQPLLTHPLHYKQRALMRRYRLSAGMAIANNLQGGRND